jgi:hypothetical protein
MIGDHLLGEVLQRLVLKLALDDLARLDLKHSANRGLGYEVLRSLGGE